MGFFSWKTADTNRSISNKYSVCGTFPVYVLCPDGTKIREDNYDGYGNFGGRDIYALFAQWNKPDACKDADGNWLNDLECRNIGIDLAFGEEVVKYPIKIVEDGSLNYNYVGCSERCDCQGYFYDIK